MPDMEMVRRFAGADSTEAAGGPLELSLRAAVSWFEGAGVPAGMEDPDYDFWVCNLAAWMYDHRGDADVSSAIPAWCVTCVHQLRAKAKKTLNKQLAALGAETEDDETLQRIAAAIASGSNLEKAELIAELTPDTGDDTGDPSGDTSGEPSGDASGDTGEGG